MEKAQGLLPTQRGQFSLSYRGVVVPPRLKALSQPEQTSPRTESDNSDTSDNPPIHSPRLSDSVFRSIGSDKLTTLSRPQSTFRLSYTSRFCQTRPMPPGRASSVQQSLYVIHSRSDRACAMGATFVTLGDR